MPAPASRPLAGVFNAAMSTEQRAVSPPPVFPKLNELLAELVARVESIVETILSVPTLRTRHDVDWSGSTLVGTSRAHLTLAKSLGAHFAAA
jgi:hypothetical protein